MKEKYDVIVVGAGPGGFPAAIAAARRGLDVLLVERNAFLGGLAVSGLPLLAFLDRTGRQVVRGIGQEYTDRLMNVGASTGHTPNPYLNSLTMVDPSWGRIIVTEMCRETGMDIMLNTDLMDVKTDENRVIGIKTFSRGEVREFETGVLIDATGDAFCALFAGAECVKGESLQPTTLSIEVGNVNYDEFFAYLVAHPDSCKLPESVQVERADYLYTHDRTFYFAGFQEIIEKAREAGEYSVHRDLFDFVHWPNSSKACINVTRAVNTDSSNNKDLTLAEFTCLAQVKELYFFMRKYIPGFANIEMHSILPWMGSRESNRIVGRRTVTQAMLEALEIPEDTIALAGYNVDIHSATDASLDVRPVEHAIGIPYGCLLPTDIEGLIMSGRTISVDQIPFAMTRVMGPCLAVGHAAGVAAGLAVKNGLLPSQVDVAELRAELVKDGAILLME